MEFEFYAAVGVVTCFVLGFSAIIAATTALLIGAGKLFKRGVCSLARRFESNC